MTQTKFERRRQRDRIAVGNSYVTPREYQVIALYIDGVARKNMAAMLAMSEHTRRSHVRVAQDRLGARSIHQLVAMVAAADALRAQARASVSHSNRDPLHAARDS